MDGAAEHDVPQGSRLRRFPVGLVTVAAPDEPRTVEGGEVRPGKCEPTLEGVTTVRLGRVVEFSPGE